MQGIYDNSSRRVFQTVVVIFYLINASFSVWAQPFLEPRRWSNFSIEEKEKTLEKLKKANEKLPADHVNRTHYTVMHCYIHTIGRARIGLNGEIILLPKNSIFGNDMVSVVSSEEEEIQFITHNPKPGTVVAKVDSKGNISKAEEILSFLPIDNTALWPKQWPNFTKNKKLLDCFNGTVIYDSKKVKHKRALKMPSEAIGWVYLSVNLSICAPVSSTMAPFENVLWVFRTKEGGLRLTHSGPLHHGIYVVVHKNFEIEYVDSIGRDFGKAIGPYYWDYSNEEDQPTTIPDGLYVEHKNTDKMRLFVLNDGTVSAPMPDDFFNN